VQKQDSIIEFVLALKYVVNRFVLLKLPTVDYVLTQAVRLPEVGRTVPKPVAEDHKPLYKYTRTNKRESFNFV
jgi:hypothetical protein